MQKLIVHIEHDAREVRPNDLRDALDTALELLREGNATTEEEFADIGWRYFSSLGEAEAWESGEEAQS